MKMETIPLSVGWNSLGCWNCVVMQFWILNVFVRELCDLYAIQTYAHVTFSRLVMRSQFFGCRFLLIPSSSSFFFFPIEPSPSFFQWPKDIWWTWDLNLGPPLECQWQLSMLTTMLHRSPLKCFLTMCACVCESECVCGGER